MEAREGPVPEDKDEFHIAATGHLLEGLMATCHPPSIPDEVACKPSHTSGLPTALEEICCLLHQQCVHDPWCRRYTLASSVLQCHHLQHMCIVLAREACEGPNTQGQAGRFMAVTGHHLEGRDGQLSSALVLLVRRLARSFNTRRVFLDTSGSR